MSLSRRSGRAIHWAEAFGMSALLHVGAVVFALDFVRDLQLFTEREEEVPDLLVTSLVLDAQTLIDTLDDQGGADGVEDDLGDVPDVENPDDVPPDTLAAAEPEVEEPEPIAPEETPEAETPEEPEPETPEPVEPEAAEVAEVPELEPETPDSVEPEPLVAEATGDDPEALSPVEPAQPLQPQELSPLRPEEEELAALAPVGAATPQRLSATPTAPPPAVAPVTSIGPERVTARVTTPRVERPPLPVRPAVAPPAPGSPAAVVAELIAKIRARTDDPCLVAVPQQAADGSPELVMVAADESGITNFAAAVLSDIDPRPGQRGLLVDSRQCAALTFLRENASYPAFRLTLGLTDDVLPSGEELTGAVGRAAGRYVSLLLVDDNGVVQDLGTWLRFSGDQARFSVPMRRDGSPRDTSQLLIAIGTEARPRTLDTENGKLAEDFFPALQAEVGTAVPLVMIPFDVR